VKGRKEGGGRVRAKKEKKPLYSLFFLFLFFLLLLSLSMPKKKATATPSEEVKALAVGLTNQTKKLKKRESKLGLMREKLLRRAETVTNSTALAGSLKSMGAKLEATLFSPSSRFTKKEQASMKRLLDLSQLVAKEAEDARKEAAAARSRLEEARELVRGAEDGLCRQLMEVVKELEESRKSLTKAGLSTTGIFNYRTDPLYDHRPSHPFS
jgi:hypothetical protein